MAKRPVKKRASKSAKGPTPSATATLNDDIGEEKRLEMWRLQLEVRHMEQRLHDLFFQNLIKGTSHLAIGQEAIATQTMLDVAAAAPTPARFNIWTRTGLSPIPHVTRAL